MTFLFGGLSWGQTWAQPQEPVPVTSSDSVSLRPSFGLDYTSELQTNFSWAKWVNLLELSAEVPLSRKFSFSLASLSAVTTNEDYLARDLQVFSNIEVWNIPFALTVAGFTWHINDRHSLFAGIRRIDEDYFCSDAMSLFTNSSCGGFPTITANCPVIVYPVSALGIHYAYDRENLATCNVDITKYLSLQPVLHIIKTDNETNCIGVLRLNVSL